MTHEEKTVDFKAIGLRIKSIRKKRGLSQQTLSELVDCTPTHISYCENGTRQMTLEMLVRLANALNASSDEFLCDSLENTVKVSNHEFSSLLNDCSEFEKNVLLDVLTATKNSLRSHALDRRTRWK